MSTIIGRLKKGDLLLAGEMNETQAHIRNGLLGYYPLKDSLIRTDSNDGLIHYFPFKGDLLDKVGTNTLTALGTSFDLFSGVIFSTKAGSLKLTTPISSSTLAVEMYYTFNGTNGVNNTILGIDGGTYHHLLVDSTTSQIGFWTNTGWHNSGYTMQIGREYHLLLIKLATRQLLYIDGQLVQDSNNSFNNATYPLVVIGNNSSGAGASQGSLGVIRDLKIYNQAQVGGRGFDSNETTYLDAATNFNGTTDYINVGTQNLDFSKGFHFKFRAKWSALVNNSRILDFGNGAPNDSFIIANEGTTNKLIFNIYNGTVQTNTIGSAAIIVGETAEWIISVDAAKIATIYKNGLRSGLSVSFSAFPVNVARSLCYIGKSNWGDPMFQGTIEYVHFFDREYDPSNIFLSSEGVCISDSTSGTVPGSYVSANTNWTRIGCTISTIEDRHVLMETTANSGHYLRYDDNIPARQNNINYTISAYVKPYGRTWCFLRTLSNVNASAIKYAYFNLATGTVGTDQTNGSAQIVPIGDGWYRISMTDNSGIGGFSWNVWGIGSTTGNGVLSYVGDPTKGILFYRMQTENKTYTTGFINAGRRSTTEKFMLETTGRLGTGDFTVGFTATDIPKPGIQKDKPWIAVSDATKTNYLNFMNGWGADFYYGDNTTRSIASAIGFSYLPSDNISFFLTRSGTTWNTRIFINGVLNRSETISNASYNFSADQISIASGVGLEDDTDTTALSGICRDLYLYNRVLSDAELGVLVNLRTSFTKVGDLRGNLREKTSKDNWIHLDLRHGGAGYNQEWKPSSEANAIYTSDGVWSGTPTTNLIDNLPSAGKLGVWGEPVACTTAFDGAGPITPYAIRMVSDANANARSEFPSASGNNVYSAVGKPAVAANSWVTASIWARGKAGGESMRIIIFEYDAVGSYSSPLQNFTLTKDWKQYTYTKQIAPTTTKVWIRPDNMSANATVWWDAPQIEVRSFPTPYVNGTRSDTILNYPSNIVNVTSNFTMMGWFYPLEVDTSKHRGILCRDNGGTDRTLIVIDSSTSNLSCWYGNSTTGSIINTGSIVDKNKWHFFALCRNGNNLTLYHGKDNIIYIGTGTDANILDTQSAIDNWNVGSWLDPGNVLDGYMKDVMFISSALSDAEIKASYKTQIRLTKDGTANLQGQVIERQVL